MPGREDMSSFERERGSFQSLHKLQAVKKDKHKGHREEEKKKGSRVDIVK